MGGVKDQKLQPYKSERKRSTKQYTKLFKEAANYFGTYCLCALWRNMKKLNHLDLRQEIKELLEAYRKALQLSCPGSSQKTLILDRLTTRHFVERILLSETEAKPMRDGSLLQGKTVEGCFKIYHITF